MKGYPVDYLLRWFWNSLLLACFTLSVAYPVAGREGKIWFVAVFALGVVMIPWIFVPVMWLSAGLVLLSATPAGYLLGATQPPGLSGEQVCAVVALVAAIVCPLKAYPLWESVWGEAKDKSLGPKDFWLTPLLLAGFIASAYLSGANAHFCLALLVFVQGWQLWQALRLDHAAYKALPRTAACDAPIGA